MQERITVVIPTYNREKLLGRALDSLERQTYKNFICMIIDDGSTDNTKQLVDSYKKNVTYTIKYFYKDNGGVIDALRFGLDRVETELVTMNGSDDEYTDNALEVCLNAWDSLTDKEREYYMGIKALTIDYSSKKIVGKKFPQDINSCSYKKYFRCDVGEKSNTYKTEIIRKQFHEYKEVMKGTHFRFIPEGTLHVKYEMIHKLYCINQPMRIYHQENPEGYCRGPMTKEDYEVGFFSNTYMLRTYYPSEKLPFNRYFWNAVYSVKFGMLLKKRFRDIYLAVGNRSNRLVLTCAIPFGIGNYLLGLGKAYLRRKSG